MKKRFLLLTGFSFLLFFMYAGTALAAEKTAAKAPLGEQVVATALQYRGVPYKYGGSSPQGFDCSGLVMFVYDKNGKKLPRTADKQFEFGSAVDKKDLKAGDLVFFAASGKEPSHCGIFAGNGNFIHASSSHGVMVSPLTDPYWRPKFIGARRVLSS